MSDGDANFKGGPVQDDHFIGYQGCTYNWPCMYCLAVCPLEPEHGGLLPKVCCLSLMNTMGNISETPGKARIQPRHRVNLEQSNFDHEVNLWITTLYL
jgi:hypothetical protein